MRQVWFIGMLLVALLLPRTGDAFCGFYVSGADDKLFNNATMVVMMREGTLTVLSMQNNYQGPPEEFALVVPVPVVLQEENVKTLDAAVFDRVDRLAAPRLVEYWEQDPCRRPRVKATRAGARTSAAAKPDEATDAAEDFGVTVEAQFTVGEYEIVILSAKDSTGLDRWLRTNKYKIPEAAEPVLKPYVEQGMKFFVAKVNTEKVKFRDGQVMLSPLRFHYDSDDFSLPVRLGMLNSNGKQDLMVHILAQGKRFEVANYENVTIPTNVDVDNGVRENFGEFYAAMFDLTLAKNPGSVVTEYAWDASSCDPCPVPALRFDELMTLGADVVRARQEADREGNDPKGDIAAPSPPPPPATVTVGAVSVSGGTVANAKSVVNSMRGRFRACYRSGARTTPNMSGAMTLVASLGPNGEVVNVGGGAQGALSNIVPCAKAVVRSAAFTAPTGGSALVTIPVTFSTGGGGAAPRIVAPRRRPPSFTPRGFVLTRLHVRYDKESMKEDLSFREAGAIVGGREHAVAKGKLEKGAQPGSINNFQARYAIRHPWKGEVKCDNPTFGIWGGPPKGEKRSQPKAATNLAFVKRGQVKLASLLFDDVPELEITAGAQRVRRPTPVVKDKPADKSADPDDGEAAAEESGCGCTVTGASSSWGLAWLVVGAALLARRRRRWALCKPSLRGRTAR